MNKSPFLNDPFVLLSEIFERFYPNHPYEAFVTGDHFYDEVDGKETECFGVTNFPDDGGTPQIILCTHIPYESVVEIFAHELAHLATSDAAEEHGAEFDEAFTKLNNEFNRIMDME